MIYYVFLEYLYDNRQSTPSSMHVTHLYLYEILKCMYFTMIWRFMIFSLIKHFGYARTTCNFCIKQV